MNLARAVLEVHFSSPAKQFNLIPDIVRGFGGGEIKDSAAIPPIPGNFRLQFKEKKINFYINALRYSIVIEENDFTLDECKDTMLDLTKKLVERLTWENMSQAKLRTTWVHPVDNFNELVQKFKTAIFTPNTLLKRANDVAYPLTMTHNGANVEYISGPMEKKEIRTHGFEFPIETPDCFTYIDITYSKNLNQSISLENLQKFLQTASDFSTEISVETITLLKV